MATTFDGDNLLITLNAGGSVHTVDAQVDLYSDWKEWVKLADNAKYPPAFRTTGGDPLTPGISAGAYFFIRNDLGWRIKPAEEDATITLIGNLAPEDATLGVFNPTVGAFTVAILGLQPITQSVAQILTEQQSAAFNGKVAIDTVNGVSGTGLPVGYASNPVNNLADAVTIAAREGIRWFTLRGAITLNQAFDNYTFESIGRNDLIIFNSQSVQDSKFIGCTLQGAASNSDIEASKCHLDNLSAAFGHFHQCGIENNMTISGDTTIVDGYSDIAGNTKPWVSLNGGAYSLGVRGWHGGFELRSVTNVAARVSFDGDAARLLLAASCTAGEIVVGHGVFRQDSSAGSTVINTHMDPQDLVRVKKATVYRQYTNPSTGNLDIYDDDDVLDQSVPIFEDDGTTPWDGAGPIVRRNKVT